MKELNTRYNYEIVDDEVILYNRFDEEFTPIIIDSFIVDNSMSNELMAKYAHIGNFNKDTITEKNFNAISEFQKEYTSIEEVEIKLIVGDIYFVKDIDANQYSIIEITRKI